MAYKKLGGAYRKLGGLGVAYRKLGVACRKLGGTYRKLGGLGVAYRKLGECWEAMLDNGCRASLVPRLSAHQEPGYEASVGYELFNLLYFNVTFNCADII